ncbi:uncharacterized protein LOC62_02G003489 [Vanrija pseudolonga]|uniref:Uncharacterized protein n=1 Tax=Vanrija pseudolonga TaxID=143232 RepID=A0AAF0YAF2_9TREE|nr:hypothetical protein LOC62_02G003489 [Vanrija pseudolonga]
MPSTHQNLARQVRFDDGTRPFKVQPTPKSAKPRASNTGLPRSPAMFDLAAVLSEPASDCDSASKCSTPREYVPRDPRVGQKPRPTALLTPPPSP